MKGLVGSCATALLLAACGGGGDSGGLSATGDFTQENHVNASEKITEAVFLSLDAKSLLGYGLITGGGSGSVSSSAQPLSAGPRPPVPALNQTILQEEILKRLSTRPHPERAMPAGTMSNSTACSGGGSLVFTASWSNEDAPTVGDRIVVTSQGCVEQGEVFGGSLTSVLRDFQVSAIQGELDYIKVVVTAADFGSPTLRVQGEATLEVKDHQDGQQYTGTTFSVAYSGMVLTTPSQSLTLNHRYALTFPATGDPSLALEGFATLDGKHYRLEQKTPYAISRLNGYPKSGILSAFDKEGDRVDVQALVDRFTYTYYRAGQETPTAGPSNGRLYGQY